MRYGYTPSYSRQKHRTNMLYRAYSIPFYDAHVWAWRKFKQQ